MRIATYFTAIKSCPKLSSLAMDSQWWMPPNAALHGIAVDRMMRFNLIALCVCFVVAHLLLLTAILRRKNASETASRLPRFWLMEAVPLTLLCALYAWMAITAQKLWAENRFEGASPEAMQVEVVGVQFEWYFRYPGEDATFGITRPEMVNPAAGNPLGLDVRDPNAADDIVASELVLPAGREVDITLRAQDVIHGFFVPAMRLKQNAVPGLALHVHFTPEVVGEYPILCSQVCGLGHAKMQAILRVVPQEKYAAWINMRGARIRTAHRVAEVNNATGGAR
jgi:cytochrome c oxidase subunit II